MNKAKSILIIIATCFLVVGLIVFIVAMVALSFDFTRLSTAKYLTNIYDVNGDFENITVDVVTSKIEFLPSDSENCKVVCFEKEREKHTVAVENGVLKIGTIDTRKWYDHFGFSFTSPKITIYLPRSEYASLTIKTHTGDIKIPKDFAFESVNISGSTANVKCKASVSKKMNVNLSTGDVMVNEASLGDVELSVTTGNIDLNYVNCGNIKVTVSTGRTGLTDVKCNNFTSNGTTGDVILNSVIIDGLLSVERSTGDITFNDSDATELNVETTTGNVTGTLLSEKIFIANTSTGRIDLPYTTSGGKCKIRTTTGNINISIK